ncbi:sigma factor [Thermoanaerobacter wiegelii]|uniref:sigma factor n=1 Tax=Thermoanaerobacter wiegelii TaxID=46354 RepID=UPI0001E50080|nr:sigma factor [Thermoanaerobacter wiegelii]
MNIEELVSRAKKGDDDAFYELISNLKEQLYRIAFSYLKNEEESLEALQEVTYRVYINIKKLKKAKYFNSWVIRIMINYCINELRNKKRFTNKEVLEEKELQETNSFMNFD